MTLGKDRSTSGGSSRRGSDGNTLFVSQQGGKVDSGEVGVTYAITGPFDRKRGVPLRPGQRN